MKIILGGVRGTACVSEPGFLKYGGDTTSVLLEGEKGERVIIDAGTGIRRLGRRLEQEPLPPSILLLITHYHLDHLMGLPSLSLLYRRDASFLVASPRRNGRSVRETIPQIMAQPYWPVQMEELHSSIEFLDWPDEASPAAERFGGLGIRWCGVHHPGGCTAYRIDEASTGRSLVFATDVEWARSTPAEKEALARLCAEPRPANLLICDGQFSRADYGTYAGWGHSAWEDAAALAGETKAGLLVVTHHAPQSDDARLERVEKELAEALPGARLGRDGMGIEL